MIYLSEKAEQRLFLQVGLRRDIYEMPVFISHVFCEHMLLFSRENPTLTPQLFIQFQAV